LSDPTAATGAPASPRPRYKRKLSNYLLDKKLQLRYVLIVTVLSGVIAGALGFMIYQQRREAMQGENLKPAVMDMIEDLVEGLLAEYTDAKTYAEDWDLESLNNEAFRLFGSNPQYRVESMEDVTQEGLREDLLKRIRERYDARERDFGEPLMRDDVVDIVRNIKPQGGLPYTILAMRCVKTL